MKTPTLTEVFGSSKNQLQLDTFQVKFLKDLLSKHSPADVNEKVAIQMLLKDLGKMA